MNLLGRVQRSLAILAVALSPAPALALRLVPPVEAKKFKDGDEGTINPFLVDAIQDTVSRSIGVKGEKAGYIVLDTGGKAYYPGTFILFFRKTATGLDMMARGEVTYVESGEALVRLDLDQVIKVPVEGDLAVPLAPPIFGDEGADEEKSDATQHEPPELPGEPGHIEFRYGLFQGALRTDAVSSTAVIPNEYKQVGAYRFPYMHGEWYPEFMWRWGLEYEAWSGIFPTSTYYREVGDTTQDYSRFTINYRFRKMLEGKLRPQLRFMMASDTFTTENNDENVIGSVYGSIGIGTRVSWEFVQPTWVTRRLQPFAVHRVYADFGFFPLVSAEDPGEISRGTAGSGTAMEWRFGATVFMYLKWMPLLKRYVIEGFYGSKTYDLGWTGATKSETLAGNVVPNPIPENTTSSESYTYWGVTVGIRLDDLIGHFLKPPEIKQ